MMTNAMTQALAVHSRCYKDYPGGGQQRLIEQALEECGELTTALAKYFRALGHDVRLDSARAQVMEEYVDVVLCLETLLTLWEQKHHSTGPTSWKQMVEFKTDRYLHRLEDMESNNMAKGIQEE